MTHTQAHTPVAISPALVRSALEHAVVTAFEHMVFLEPKQTLDVLTPDSIRVHAQLDVNKPLACSLLLELSASLVDACMDVLYCGTSDCSTQRQEVVSELTNTVAGLMMSHLSDDAPIELGLPQTSSFAPTIGSPNAVTLNFTTEAGSLRALVFIH